MRLRLRAAAGGDRAVPPRAGSTVGSVEREAVHLAVEAHVRHVPVAATVELLLKGRV